MDKIIPKLGLHSITDTELIEYAQDKINKINANAAFAGVNPSTATVQTKKTQFETALAAADNGTKGATAIKDQRRDELEQLITLQAYDCAKISNGDMPLYLTTGYAARNTKGSPTGPLSQVTGLSLDYGKNNGELIAGWSPIPDAENFTVQAFTDINNPDSSVVKEYMKHKIGRRKTTLSGLPSGQIVFIRVRANGGSTGFGPWSNAGEKRVP